MWVNPWAKPEPEPSPMPPMMPAMRRVHIVRTETSDEGTFGHCFVGNVLELYSLELPWRKNSPNISCIWPGLFMFKWRADRERYEEWDDPATKVREDVPGRERIQFHPGNVAGDVGKGYVSELQGCISLGRSVQEIILPGRLKTPTRSKQKGVTSSRDAIAAFVAALDKEPFELDIRWADNIVLA